ncbi:MAG: type II/IV secretion system ATPase subunit, partial [Halobacteriaceae archaeon]
IRQFNDVPFTPVDLINWHTFSLEQMAFLWLCIENNKSLIFAGGTASGKTTSLNAASLFIPSNTKIVSIEDTREVELPQRNWVSSVTRPSFSEEDRGDIDEFDLLEAALRQRPDYIIMGEVRGPEGRDLFQIMSTGHTSYSTFHADNVSEVLKRFTTDPINVSKTLFTALDLISVQSVTRVQGKKVRRNRLITEINEYNAENDEINVQDVFQWQPATDEFQRQPGSNTLEEIMFDRGWSADRLEEELFKREIVLAYLIQNNLNEYAQVAASLQAFISDPDTILALIAQDKLEQSLENLRQMESVIIDVDPEKEEMVPRPDPTENVLETTENVLEEARDTILAEYKDVEADIIDSLTQTEEEEDIIAQAVEERTQLQEIAQTAVEGDADSSAQTMSTANGGEVQPPTEDTEEETEEEVAEPESPEESEPPEEPEAPEEPETSEESEPDEASETAEEPETAEESTEEESAEEEEDEFEIFESALVEDEEDEEATSDTDEEADEETTDDTDEEGSS